MISCSEMKALENEAEKKGVSKLTLMENAGKKVAEILEEKSDLKGKRVLVVAYHGNNGGDGFVAARHLADKAEVEVLFLGTESGFKPEAAESFKRINADPKIQFIGLELVDFDDYDIIIDALLGMGIEGSLKAIFQSTIDRINDSKAFKVSVDIPSGLNPDTGEIHDRAVEADLIITFHDMKKGLEKMKDKTVVADIGIP
ncbi:NAD(P)H-hydrate epimerase [Candidatus Woesearchaeota archaeon]|nr:NAD(P)H-hydrate epimerase [Candidatus Woesearchaeota archaeon]